MVQSPEAQPCDAIHPDLSACWLATPAERNPLFFPAFAAMSLAIQATLRERVPLAYLLNTEVFSDTRLAYPVLVYQASRPFHGKGRADLTYDVLDEALMKLFYRRAKKGLVDVLAGAVARLESEQRNDLAPLYRLGRLDNIVSAVQRNKKSRAILFDLLVGEAALVNELRRLAGLGDLRPRDQAKRSATVAKAWNFHLRRLCPGWDFRSLAHDLLESAGAALTKTLTPGEERLAPDPESESLFDESDPA